MMRTMNKLLTFLRLMNANLTMTYFLLCKDDGLGQKPNQPPRPILGAYQASNFDEF